MICEIISVVYIFHLNFLKWNLSPKRLKYCHWKREINLHSWLKVTDFHSLFGVRFHTYGVRFTPKVWNLISIKSKNLPILFKSTNFSLFFNSGSILTLLEWDFTPRNLKNTHARSILYSLQMTLFQRWNVFRFHAHTL